MIEIRHAQLKDCKKLMAIEASAGNLFGSLSHEFLRRLPRDLPNHPQEFYENSIRLNSCLIITVNEEAVGFITTESISKNQLYISEFSIHENYQKRGLGSKLLNYLINDAKEQGIALMTLTTFINVPWNAPFYAHYGFQIIEENKLPSYLQKSLQEEAELGLPKDERCAMILNLM